MIYAKKMGMEIKLIGQCKKMDNQVYSMVAPMFLKPSHPLSNVHGVFNAILIKGNVIGDVMFYGAGAGKLPTASAVVADIIDAVKHKGKNIITKWSTKPLELMSIDEVMSRFYIRLKTANRKALKEKVSVLIGDVEWIEIEEEADTIALVTLPIKEGHIKDLVTELALLESVEVVESMIRMES
jgi:homoserine dehydrogenase